MYRYLLVCFSTKKKKASIPAPLFTRFWVNLSYSCLRQTGFEVVGNGGELHSCITPFLQLPLITKRSQSKSHAFNLQDQVNDRNFSLNKHFLVVALSS